MPIKLNLCGVLTGCLSPVNTDKANTTTGNIILKKSNVHKTWMNTCGMTQSVVIRAVELKNSTIYMASARMQRRADARQAAKAIKAAKAATKAAETAKGAKKTAKAVKKGGVR